MRGWNSIYGFFACLAFLLYLFFYFCFLFDWTSFPWQELNDEKHKPSENKSCPETRNLLEWMSGTVVCLLLWTFFLQGKLIMNKRWQSAVSLTAGFPHFSSLWPSSSRCWAKWNSFFFKLSLCPYFSVSLYYNSYFITLNPFLPPLFHSSFSLGLWTHPHLIPCSLLFFTSMTFSCGLITAILSLAGFLCS